MKIKTTVKAVATKTGSVVKRSGKWFWSHKRPMLVIGLCLAAGVSAKVGLHKLL